MEAIHTEQERDRRDGPRYFKSHSEAKAGKCKAPVLGRSSQILAFNIEALYEPGREDVVADAISRRLDFMSVITSSKVDKGEEEKNKGENWRKYYEECTDFQEVCGRFKALSQEAPARQRLSECTQTGLPWNLERLEVRGDYFGEFR